MFKQITSLGLPTELVQPFCIQSTDQNDFLITSKLLTYCLKQSFQRHTIKNCFDLSFAKVPCPKSCPTEKIPSNEARIYGTANRSEQHEVMLDQTLLPQFSTPYVQTKCAAWSPKGVYGSSERMVGYLNTFGALEVCMKDKHSRSYSKFLDISEVWTNFILQTNSIELCADVAELKRLNADIVLTVFCWKPILESDIAHLMCATRSGKLVLWSIRSGENMLNLEMLLKTEFSLIQALKWISVGNKNFLVVGNYEGKVDLYEIDLNNANGTCNKIHKLVALWDSADKIIVSHIEQEFVEQSTKVLITCVKGAYIVFFLINASGCLLSDAHEYIGNLAVTGMQKMTNLKYIVCSYNNVISQITVHIDENNNLTIEKTTMRTDMSLDKFAIYGVAATRNLVCWLFVVYPKQTYDHLTLRQPLQIFICSLDEYNPYHILKSNPTLSFADMLDCAECIRYYGMKDITTTKVLEATDLELEFSDFRITKLNIYKLKLYLLGMVARTSYHRFRNSTQANIFGKCCSFVESVLINIRYYQILQRLHAQYFKNGGLSDQQLTSGKYLRISLTNHIEDDQFEELKDFQNLIVSLFELLIEETAYLDAVETSEMCLLCDGRLLPTRLSCSHNHLVARCAFSRMQVPFLKNYKKCSQCNRTAVLNDAKLLNEIVFNDAKLLLCPICDTKLI